MADMDAIVEGAAMDIADLFWQHMEKFGTPRVSIPHKGWPELDTQKALVKFLDKLKKAGKNDSYFDQKARS